MKLCKDCKHYNFDPVWTTSEYKTKYAVCALSDLVNGVGEHDCRDERAGYLTAFLLGRCGRSGRFWEPKK